MGQFRVALLTPLVLATACQHAAPREAPSPKIPPPRAEWTLDSAPAELKPALQQANAAISALQTALLQRLVAALEEGGSKAALEACATQAQPLTREVAQDQGLAVGRTSHQLRNPANAPRPWAAGYVQAHAGAKAADSEPRVFDLGDAVGVLRPIPTGAMCLGCHGKDVSTEVATALAATYPADQARGFSEGDLRGFFWVEVPKRIDVQ